MRKIHLDCSLAKFVIPCLVGAAFASAILGSAPAEAEECLLDTNDNGAADAADTDGGARSIPPGMPIDGLACGVGATTGNQAVAVGNRSNASPSAVAVGAGATAVHDAIAVGQAAQAFGAGGVAIGEASAVGADSGVAIGNRAFAGPGVAIGALANAGPGDNVAIGTNASTAAAQNAIAIGAGVTATTNQVAIGNASNTYQLAGLATGGATEFVTVDGGGNLGHAAIDLGGITTSVASLQSNLGGLQSNMAALQSNVSALQALSAEQTARIDSLFGMAKADREDAQKGIAAVAAMAQPAFPSGPGRTSYSSNVAYYRGEIGVSAGVMHRFDGDFGVGAGFSYAGGEHLAVKAGVAGEF